MNILTQTIPCQRDAFDIPPEVCYLNVAYMSPLLRSVLEAGIKGVSRKARPWEIASADFTHESEQARECISTLIDTVADNIALIPSAAHGLSAAAQNLPCREGQEIIVLGEQFPSNFYPWRRLSERQGGRLVVVPRVPGEDLTNLVLERIGSRTAIIAVPHCHWLDGRMLDLERIASYARSAGAALVLDLTQSAGILPFSISRIDPDFAVMATYKWLLGPYSYCFMYVAPHRHGGEPLEQSWISRADSENFARLANYTNEFQPGARRFDAGERSNFALLPMVVAALKQISEWQVERIYATVAAISRRVRALAQECGFAPSLEKPSADHLVAVSVPQHLSNTIVDVLSRNNVYASMRGNTLRLSPHLHVTEEDIYRLRAALQSVSTS